MPTIICDYCQYVGSGKEYDDRMNDVEEHEKTCTENPDYEPEPSVVKYEIKPGGDGLLHYWDNEGDKEIFDAFSRPNFIGFELEGQLWGRLYKSKKNGNHRLIIDVKLLDKYEVCDMSDAKVLFRSK